MASSVEMDELSSRGIDFILRLDEYAGICKERKLVFKRRRLHTDPNHGMIPSERPLEEKLKLGIINLDKPPGPTSHEVVAWIKRMLNLKKAGHGGTLDP